MITCRVNTVKESVLSSLEVPTCLEMGISGQYRSCTKDPRGSRLVSQDYAGHRPGSELKTVRAPHWPSGVPGAEAEGTRIIEVPFGPQRKLSCRTVGWLAANRAMGRLPPDDHEGRRRWKHNVRARSEDAQSSADSSTFKRPGDDLVLAPDGFANGCG